MPRIRSSDDCFIKCHVTRRPSCYIRCRKRDHRWFRDRRPLARGFVRADLSSNINDPDEFMAAACFADKKAYDTMSDNPDQNTWFEELRSHLVADPEWFDGTLERQRMG